MDTNEQTVTTLRRAFHTALLPVDNEVTAQAAQLMCDFDAVGCALPKARNIVQNSVSVQVTLGTGPFLLHFEVENQPNVSSSHVGIKSWVSIFGQEVQIRGEGEQLKMDIRRAALIIFGGNPLLSDPFGTVVRLGELLGFDAYKYFNGPPIAPPDRTN